MALAMVCILKSSLQVVSSMQTIFYYCHLVVMACNLCCIFVMNLAKKWDIHFNPAKTQCVTFGGQAPRQCNRVIGGKSLTWSSKLKYLGCSIKGGFCKFDISSAIGKFYSQFNNI